MQNIPDNKIHFDLSYCKPFYPNDNYRSLYSNVYQFSVYFPVSSKLNLIGNIPFINAGYHYDYGFYKNSYSETGIGNIFIGVQSNIKATDLEKSIISFGLFLPTADENISTYGLLAEYYNLQKYTPNSIGLYINYAYHKLNDEGIIYGFEAGPNILISSERRNGSGSEFLLHYGANGGYKINKLLLNVEFTGVVFISEDFVNFSDRFTNAAGFGVQWFEKIVTPRVFYKVYLDKRVREYVRGVLGAGVSVSVDEF